MASQSAHGHAITRVATAAIIAKLIFHDNKYHSINVIIEIVIITGTKIPDTLSAKCCIGAFELCASLTNLIILANVPSEFIFVTLIFIFQSRFIVQPKHSLHFSLNTGILSQVNILSSIFADHVKIFQSRAIFSQAFTTIISHSFISSISFSIIFNHDIR